jgi:TetR/AcrR family transcriptional repressor of nem operon
MQTATALVRRQGYSAFSYADLAAAVGIRKASIHHHFPSKEDLGEALVAGYTAAFSEQLDAINHATIEPVERLRLFVALYREGLARNEGCLCGVLASEIAVLPARVQAGVRKFFAVNLEWLEHVLKAGAADLRRGIEPQRDARTILSALQGAMFVALSTGDPGAFDSAADGLIAGLRPA